MSSFLVPSVTTALMMQQHTQCNLSRVLPFGSFSLFPKRFTKVPPGIPFQDPHKANFFLFSLPICPRFCPFSIHTRNPDLDRNLASNPFTASIPPTYTQENLSHNTRRCTALSARTLFCPERITCLRLAVCLLEMKLHDSFHSFQLVDHLIQFALGLLTRLDLVASVLNVGTACGSPRRRGGSR